MTKHCKLAAELFYSVGSTTGDLWLFCSVSHLNCKIQSCNAKLPEPLNMVSSLQLVLRGKMERVDGSLVKYLHQFKRQLLAKVR
ncbi:hypothetical protein CDG76_20885 [Nostoc sp. 'Peltigera membranacea cyanobiont' 210A]|uniref:hypothetical protein n=1 Tax=Nostoc sp. 'Peltigera membranacea cyanobiont' 210A TaxID=2014529 RepID=UPI000B954776|nr:hypothetical protein [Nostoc sp. 'Peltigera membranacea cyanobiont' 210A]OYD93150.1 hypothetical protein CDG76_20885 [Nostoc sp. 'Peltigera membranacea cyanobiont' 210A]